MWKVKGAPGGSRWQSTPPDEALAVDEELTTEVESVGSGYDGALELQAASNRAPLMGRAAKEMEVISTVVATSARGAAESSLKAR